MQIPTCPRCGLPVRAPGLMSSDWHCDRHGPVLPQRTWTHVGPELLAQVSRDAQVPLWSPLPLLPGWTVTGLATAGDDRGGPRATALALSGPSPLGGPADMVLVAEEPSTGLGGRTAGTEALDPGLTADGAPDAKVQAAGHDTPLWLVDSADDRIAFAGEALGVWLWAVLWPPAAELVLLEHVELHDLRHESHVGLDLPVGAPTTRLG
ncbi:MAG: putative phosphotransacetylase [Frankiales bacterium]|nr:putative phosphotransacetylase [Frankiales bacterium]